MIYDYKANKIDELVAKLKDGDYVKIAAKDFLALVGKTKRGAGRKPIKFDEDEFVRVVTNWQNGEITARAAMEEVNLKPNTFYRRAKEINGMTDVKKELESALKEEKKEVKELEAQVKAEAKEVKARIKAEAKELKAQAKAEAKEAKAQAKAEAKEALSVGKMEKEILKEKIGAEADRAKEIKRIQKEVQAETKSFKSENE